MRLWRVSNYADLSGIGGTLASGRWHTRGRPILYASEHPALALLEALAQFQRRDLPVRYQMLAIDVADSVPSLAVAAPTGWANDVAASRAIGDTWLLKGDTLMLRAPSVLAPHSWNVMLNPRHAAMSGVLIAFAEMAPFDGRLR